MNKSYAAAGVLVVVLTVWMVSGLFKADSAANEQDTSAGQTEENAQPMKVQVRLLRPETMNRELTLQGQVEAKRHLRIRSDVSGTVTDIPVPKGSRVKKDDLLVKLSLDGREVELGEAKARVRAALSQEKAAKQLRKQGLQSQIQLEQAQAALASARASLNKIRLDVVNTQILAPFDGILNGLPVELGQQIDRGSVVADVVDDSAFIVTATAAQQTINSLSPGQPVEAKLITGDLLPGKITFISAIADPTTRSFEIEAEVVNRKAAIAAGVSASLVVPVESVDAFFVSPSSISLGPDGEIGVKTVNPDNVVEFHTVSLVQTTHDGAWVTGIPAGSRLITLGQGFVSPGQTVEPVIEPNDSAEQG